LGKLKKSGYIFITWIGDHDPYHVHIFKDGKEIAKYNLEDNVVIKGKINNKILKAIAELRKEKRL
tara:strand:- start:66867 stop:67061 length:195 start_codon:yes stop_codon:yes gene_type:complete